MLQEIHDLQHIQSVHGVNYLKDLVLRVDGYLVQGRKVVITIMFYGHLLMF